MPIPNDFPDPARSFGSDGSISTTLADFFRKRGRVLIFYFIYFLRNLHQSFLALELIPEKKSERCDESDF